MQIVNVRDVAREVRGLRRRHMLRQGEVARAVGVTRQWISQLEGGKASLELGLVLRAFDELGLDLVATRREPPPPWTRPLTEAAETREYRSINRLRRKRMEAREKARSSAEGGSLVPVVAPSGERELEDIDYYNMIMDLRAKRGIKTIDVTPTKDKR